jgi:hypothetical protein
MAHAYMKKPGEATKQVQTEKGKSKTDSEALLKAIT